MPELLRRLSSRSRAKPLVSVLTPTIEGRETFLAENIASVKAQTFRRYEHLILLDEERVGCSATMNALASASEAEWLFILADDDLMLPRCLELHAEAMPHADIVYAPPLVWGEDSAQFCAGFPGIPATAMISRAWWEKMGGYRDVPSAEDNDFYKRSEQRGVRYTRIDSHPTWVYRFWGGNKSR